MTGNMIFDAVIIFLIAYAMLNIFYEFTGWLKRKYAGCKPRYHLVFEAAHGDVGLECGLRSALSLSCNLQCMLFVITDNLTTEEEDILWRLTEGNAKVFFVPKTRIPEELLFFRHQPQ